MIYLDTNVIIDIIDDTSERQRVCVERLEEALAEGPVYISDCVYAETAVGMESREMLDAALEALRVSRLSPNEDALFTAGKAFKRYKEQNGGTKNNVLPDFFIGAQAFTEGCALITSDVKRMTGYFEGLEVINTNV